MKKFNRLKWMAVLCGCLFSISGFGKTTLFQIHFFSRGFFSYGYLSALGCETNLGFCADLLEAGNPNYGDKIECDGNLATFGISKKHSADDLKKSFGGPVFTFGGDSYLHPEVARNLGLPADRGVYIPKGDYKISSDKEFYYITVKLATK
ncbi:MAG: hypothetical protein U0T73_10785 [Chitinophagales bacterium]